MNKILPVALLCILLVGVLPSVRAAEPFIIQNGAALGPASDLAPFTVKCGDGYFVFWYQDQGDYQLIQYRYVSLSGTMDDVHSLDTYYMWDFMAVSQAGDYVLVSAIDTDYNINYWLGIMNNNTHTIEWTRNSFLDYEVYPLTPLAIVLVNSTHAYFFGDSHANEPLPYARYTLYLFDLSTADLIPVKEFNAISQVVPPYTEYVCASIFKYIGGQLRLYFACYEMGVGGIYYEVDCVDGTWTDERVIYPNPDFWPSPYSYDVSEDGQYLLFLTWDGYAGLLRNTEWATGGWNWSLCNISFNATINDATTPVSLHTDGGSVFAAVWLNEKLYVYEVRNSEVIKTTELLYEPALVNNFITHMDFMWDDGIMVYDVYTGWVSGAIFEPFVPTSISIGNYVVNIPPFVLESTTPFITTHYQPDGGAWVPMQGKLYFEVVGGGDVNVTWSGVRLEYRRCSGWSTIPFLWSDYVSNNPVRVGKNYVNFTDIPEGNVVIWIEFKRYGSSGIGSNADSSDTWVEEGGDANAINDVLNNINENLDNLVSKLPIPEQARGIFKITILGLPWLILILALIMIGGIGNWR